ncbi:hypothetical protein Hanom_Chr05g00465711 [Helianthus anomalus]
MDITESRLGVGRKSNQRHVSLRAGGVNALRTISLLAWCRRLSVFILRVRVILFAGNKGCCSLLVNGLFNVKR